ncbi:putative Splicing factor 45 [Hypsibius exemplaris]|uniref:Splicing factor 45 n=1 Tax=Hypsibius exemplaris TaxID=2072580 RepID=A0A1W0X7W9_HYPEX|nr:putative Splicing factor 45 [Hypsibius exemplaris]
MSLYDGVDVDANGNESTGAINPSSASASSIKFLQSQLLLKKAALQQSKFSSQKAPSLVPSHVAQKARPSTLPTAQSETPSKLDFLHHDPMNLKIENEYDPLYPNEYDQVKAVQKAEAAALAAATRNPFEATFSNTIGVRSQLSLPDKDQQDDDEDADYDAPLKLLGQKRAGAAFPPPPSQAAETGSSDGIFKAAKMMAKFGYKAGQGLGRQEQGMSTALQVEKTGLRLGKIIHESSSSSAGAPSHLQSSFLVPPPPIPKQPTLAELLKNQTKVVLLRNMVGPGEVDNDLEPEVREEAKKYGEVVSCMVYEMPGKPEDEAIRIFIEFAKIEQAVKAVVDFNGRFFGGRGVKAGFYNPDRFKKFQLAD